MTVRTYEDAMTAGRRYAIGKVCDETVLENIIFEAMAENPFKGKEARKNFIEGVSQYVNASAARRNNRMNEKIDKQATRERPW